MKRFAVFMFALLLVAAPAFAAKTPSVHFVTAAAAGTTKIAPGDYKVTWTGSGDSVQLTLQQDKTKITLAAKQVDKKSARSSYIVKTVNGAEQLQSIQLVDTAFAIQAN
jgi:hypothetical protein